MKVQCCECGARNVIPDEADPAHMTCHKCGNGLARPRPKLDKNLIRVGIIEAIDDILDSMDLDCFDNECEIVHEIAEELQGTFC